MSRDDRLLFWVEAALAGFCVCLGVLTIFWRDWIEAFTGHDPDDHDGSVEWLIVIALLVIGAGLALAARTEWRRLHAIANP